MFAKIWRSDYNLRRVNYVLVCLIVVINAYIVVTPFLPKVTYKISNIVRKPANVSVVRPDTIRGIPRDTNQLYIPKIKLAKPILEGTDPNTVNRGIWRRPISATPDKQSNTVLVGHRFSYKNPSVLYLLDEVKIGDEVFVTWDKKIYAYKVDTVRVVSPSEVSIEDPTEAATLTIYTCTPLWSTSHRLVVQAKLEKVF